MKKKQLVITTVGVTALILMASVTYTCSKSPEEVKETTKIEEQVNTEVTTEEETTLQQVAPVITTYEKEVELNLGDTLTLEQLKVGITSVHDTETNFTEKTYNEVGTFDETITFEDKVNGLSTSFTVKVKVKDSISPEILGVKNIVVVEGEAIDLLAGVTAKDNLDGDLTSSIQVSSYDANLLDKDQEITYTVADKSGNTTTAKAVLHIKQNPIQPLDKIMYSTSSINVRAQSNADSDLVGSLGYAEAVHVTGRDKNTGWFRIDFNGTSAWVSDSYLSDTKPHVEKPTQSQVQQDTPSPSDCQSDCDCDCDCDCASDCDCSGGGTIVDIEFDSFSKEKATIGDYDPYAW